MAGEIAAGLARLGPADACTGLVNWASILMHSDIIFIRRPSILLNRASTLQQMRIVIRVLRFSRGLRRGEGVRADTESGKEAARRKAERIAAQDMPLQN